MRECVPGFLYPIKLLLCHSLILHQVYSAIIGAVDPGEVPDERYDYAVYI